MSQKFNVTPRAKDDLQDIAEYTLGRWGAAQMVRYLTDMDDRFAWLAESPETGIRRDDVRPDLRSFVQGSHLIFYRLKRGGIEIIAVLHQSSDVQTNLRGRP